MSFNFRDAPISAAVLVLIISFNIAVVFHLLSGGYIVEEMSASIEQLDIILTLQVFAILLSYVSMRRFKAA